MPLQVIGAGHPRTGTMSLSVALTQLGFPCYHMIDVFKHNDTDKWLQAYHTTCAGGHFDVAGTFFSRPGVPEYTAAVDVPPIVWYKQLLKENPGIKVILTVRDTPEVWHQSVLDTVYAANSRPSLTRRLAEILLPGPMRNHRKLVMGMYFDNPDIMGVCFEDREAGAAAYTRWNEEVRKVVPPKQLLVFNVKQGWEPLCAFLGVPVPKDKPFPRINDTASFNARIVEFEGKLQQVMLTAGAVVTALTAGLAYAVYRRQQRS